MHSCFCFDSVSTMGCCAKQAKEEAQRTNEHHQQPTASMSETFMNKVHPSSGIDFPAALHFRGCPLLVVHFEFHRRQAQRRGCGGHVEEEFWLTSGLRQPRVVDCGVFFQQVQVQGVVCRCGLRHHQCHRPAYPPARGA